MNPVAEKLRAARKLIEQGWTRGELCRDGRVCAMGALYAAFNGDPENARQASGLERAHDLLMEASGFRYTGMWNDAQKSKKPVLAAFDRAIEIAESGK